MIFEYHLVIPQIRNLMLCTHVCKIRIWFEVYLTKLSINTDHGARSHDHNVVVKKTVQRWNWCTKAREPALHARMRQVVHRGELGT